MVKKLSVYDFPDRTWEPDGYDMKQVPSNSAANIEVLRLKINEIVELLGNLRNASLLLDDSHQDRSAGW